MSKWEFAISPLVPSLAPGIDEGGERRLQPLTASFNWHMGREAGESSISVNYAGRPNPDPFTCTEMQALHAQAEDSKAQSDDEALRNKEGEAVSMCDCFVCVCLCVLCHQQSTPLRQTAGMRVHCKSLEYQ